MTIVGGLDVHRRQITFNYLDTETGEEQRGRINDADRDHVRDWIERSFADRSVDVVFALEGCTGWRYVAEVLDDANIEVHLADPAEAQACRGRKKRAKTDSSDALLLRNLLIRDDLPESWIPPEHILEVRTLVRLYKSLLDNRSEWQQRMQAVIFHQGVPETKRLCAQDRRKWLLRDAALSLAGRRQIRTGYAMIDAVNADLVPLRADLERIARDQTGCRALIDAQYGIGPLTSAVIWAEMGDCRRFANSRAAVRHTGLDITVYSSNNKRSPGHLSRQGPGVLRWALYEAGKCASRKTSPDHAYYQQVKDRCDGKIATLSVARRIVRRAFHILAGLGDEALCPPADWPTRQAQHRT